MRKLRVLMLWFCAVMAAFAVAVCGYALVAGEWFDASFSLFDAAVFAFVFHFWKNIDLSYLS